MSPRSEMSMGSRPHRAIVRRSVVTMAVIAGLMAPSFFTTSPAASQAAPPVITDLDVEIEVSVLYVYIGAYLQWSVDPEGSQPSHYRIELTSDAGAETLELVAPVNEYTIFDMRPETTYDIVFSACVGEADAESCDTVTTTLTTPALEAGRVELDTLTAIAVDPTTISLDWTFSDRTNVPIVITLVGATPAGGTSPVLQEYLFDGSSSYVWTGAAAGTTYSVAVQACGGPTPSTLVCGGASTSVTTPTTQPVVTGRLVSHDGPLAGATVAAAADSDVWYPTALTTTGPDGTFVLEGLPVGTYKLFALSPPGRHLGTYWHGGDRSRAAATPITLDASTSAVDVELVFPERTSISGSVTVGGAPLAGATAWLYRPTDVWVGPAVATTRADGSFVLSGLDPGTYKVFVKPPPGTAAATWIGGQNRSSAREFVVDGTTSVVDASVDVAPT